jgi:NAD(P)H-hydrate repair Nnr-like enzyme with NAD(P)H-hydrate epimerase domain
MIIDGLKGYLIKDDDRRYVKELIDRFNNENKIKIEVKEFNG